MTDLEAVRTMQNILGSLAIAFSPDGADPGEILWTELPRLVYELQAELANAHGMVEAVLRNQQPSRYPA